jgi:hypothetical protein
MYYLSLYILLKHVCLLPCLSLYVFAEQPIREPLCQGFRSIVTTRPFSFPANNLVCIRRIHRTTFHMSVTWKFDKVVKCVELILIRLTKIIFSGCVGQSGFAYLAWQNVHGVYISTLYLIFGIQGKSRFCYTA